MIRVIYRWRVAPDLAAQFARWWHQGTIGIRRDHAGALGSLLLRSRDDPHVFVGVARWETEQQLAEFRRRTVPLSFDGAELEAIELLDELDDLTEDRRVGAERPPEHSEVVHLSTKRLLLEPLSRHHSAGMFLMWSREEVCRYSGPALDWAGDPIRLPATTSADSDRIIEFFEYAAATGRGFRWAVIRRGGEGFVGTVGFNSLSPTAELAFHLRPEFWGLGLMREAAEAGLGWIQMQRPGLRIEAFIEPDNVRSIGLAGRLGFRTTGVFNGRSERYVLAS